MDFDLKILFFGFIYGVERLFMGVGREEMPKIPYHVSSLRSARSWPSSFFGWNRMTRFLI